MVWGVRAVVLVGGYRVSCSEAVGLQGSKARRGPMDGTYANSNLRAADLGARLPGASVRCSQYLPGLGSQALSTAQP